MKYHVVKKIAEYFQYKRRHEYIEDGVIFRSHLNDHLEHPPRNFKCVESHWLYNRLQIQGGIILIDARNNINQEEGVIKGAIHVPWTNAYNIEEITQYLSEDAAFLFGRRKILEVIVYDHYGDLCCTNNEWSIVLCNMFAEERVTTVLRYLSGTFSPFT